MDTSKVSLPPIRQMLSDLSRDHHENEETTNSLSSTCSRPSDHDNKQLNYRQISLPMKHNNNSSSSDAYIFDAWHECLSPGSKTVASCKCPPNGMVYVDSSPVSAPSTHFPLSPTFNNRKIQHRHWQQQDAYALTSNHSHLYQHDQYPSRHRRAHSASNSIHPFIRTPTSSLSSASPPLQQRHQPFEPYHMHQDCSPKLGWGSPTTGRGKALYGGRMRAHTTSGYLPTAAMINSASATTPMSIQTKDISFSSSPSCSESSSSSSSSSAASLSPTSSSPFVSPFNTMIKPSAHLHPHIHPHNDSLHVTLPPSSGTAQQQQQRHRYHCPHCRKTFSRPSSLRIHVYSHTGEKPHVCPYLHCGRRFSVQSNMRRHIRVHIGNNNNNNSNNGIALPHGDSDLFPKSADNLHIDQHHYHYHPRHLQHSQQQHSQQQQQRNQHPHPLSSHLMLHGH